MIRLHTLSPILHKLQGLYTQQWHCDDHNACHTPGARMVCSALHSIKAVCQPGWCPVDGLTGLWELTVKAQCLSACLPPRYTWPSYQPI